MRNAALCGQLPGVSFLQSPVPILPGVCWEPGQPSVGTQGPLVLEHEAAAKQGGLLFCSSACRVLVWGRRQLTAGPSLAGVWAAVAHPLLFPWHCRGTGMSRWQQGGRTATWDPCHPLPAPCPWRRTHCTAPEPKVGARRDSGQELHECVCVLEWRKLVSFLIPEPN